MKDDNELRRKKRKANPDALRSGWHARGYLPHLKVQGETYFVTFRLADSLPAEVVQRFRLERDEIVRQLESDGRKLLTSEQVEIAAQHAEKIEEYLDRGYGQCWLRKPPIGEMVANAIRYFEGDRYTLHAWVVMSNHVHVVLTPMNDHDLSTILHSIKSYTAHEALKRDPAIRAHISVGESFWQTESYDHVTRDDEDLRRVCEYTIQNPVKAGLCKRPEDWVLSSAAVPAAPSEAKPSVIEQGTGPDQS